MGCKVRLLFKFGFNVNRNEMKKKALVTEVFLIAVRTVFMMGILVLTLMWLYA